MEETFNNELCGGPTQDNHENLGIRAQFQQVMLAMREQLERQRGVIDQQQRTMDEMRMTLQASRISNTPNESLASRRARIGSLIEAEPFTGELGSVEELIIAVEKGFELYPEEFENDHRKVMACSVFLKGGPAFWFRQLKISNAVELGSWEHFKQLLQFAFGDPEAESRSRIALMELRQGSKKVLDYVREFRQLAAQARLDDRALQSLFE